MNAKYLLLIGCLAFLFTTCRKPAEDTVCDSGIITLPATITGATTGTVGTRMGFLLRITLTSGCGLLRGLESSIAGNTITLRQNGQYLGCTCTDMLQQMDVPYAYDPTRPGTYTIEVLQPTGAAKAHTFVVQ